MPPSSGLADLRIAIVTPFLDRRHGTERVLLEQLQRFRTKPGVELHVYAQRIEDLTGVVRYHPSQLGASNSILWHEIPAMRGPYLFAYIWWFVVNQLSRWKDAKFRGLNYDLVYSPGINAWDADAIAVHIVFHEFYRQIRSRLNLLGSPLRAWPRLLHRRLYYLLIMALERRIYKSPKANLAGVSQLVAQQLEHFFARSDTWVIPNAVDTAYFTPEARSSRRAEARQRFGWGSDTFVILLIGNDWEKKGLRTLLRAMAYAGDTPTQLLVVGDDDQSLFDSLIRQLDLQHRVRFERPSEDVLPFYAAADLYVGPSLEDSFALPPLEAMACGLPVITSANAGVSQLITNSVDGFVLNDPCDAKGLASLLRELCQHPDLCRKVGESAARTAGAYNWDRNAHETWEFLMGAADKKTLPKQPATG